MIWCLQIVRCLEIARYLEIVRCLEMISRHRPGARMFLFLKDKRTLLSGIRNLLLPIDSHIILPPEKNRRILYSVWEREKNPETISGKMPQRRENGSS